MTELQIGLLAIGALVVIGVLVYNRVQERRARRDTERAFGGPRSDALLEDTAPRAQAGQGAVAAPAAPGPGERAPELPDARLDYIVELSPARPVPPGALIESWRGLARRHAHRAILVGSADGRTWRRPSPGDAAPMTRLRAALQLVSRAGAVSEAELIEFRSGVETLAASVGATVAAPEMRSAVEAARALDAFCAEADLQVVLHVVAPAASAFSGTGIRAAAEAAGLALEQGGSFAMRAADGQLLYTLGARDGSRLGAEQLREASLAALSLSLDVPRTPETRRSFESMARLARQLAASVGGQLVDDNDNTLDERAVAAIAAQLDAARTALDERGFAPGSAAALRLFS
jgi:hypothetical protein